MTATTSIVSGTLASSCRSYAAAVDCGSRWLTTIVNVMLSPPSYTFAVLNEGSPALRLACTTLKFCVSASICISESILATAETDTVLPSSTIATSSFCTMIVRTIASLAVSRLSKLLVISPKLKVAVVTPDTVSMDVAFSSAPAPTTAGPER